MKRYGRLWSVHDNYDLAYGPRNKVRRHVICLPMPETQRQTYQEMQKRKYLDNQRKEIERLDRIEARRKTFFPQRRYPYGLYGPIMYAEYG